LTLLLLLYILLLSPLVGFLKLTFLPQKYKSLSPFLSHFFLFVSFVLAAFLLWKEPLGLARLSTDFSWVGFANINFGVLLTWHELLMLALVSLIALLVSIFSEKYMQSDANKRHYFAYLQLFTFAMLMLVASSNLLQTYIFWELVGFASYLLIGFWREKPEALRASRKAFLTNRVGDVGFLVGIALIFAYTHELSFMGIYSAVLAGKIPASALTLVGICVFLGAMAKSAQFPLHIWLPDAMQGPTPISALLHAATMVAAGVFLAAKLLFLFDTDTKLFIAIVGAVSMLLGAYKAIFERDIKKVLAYSTISQLGLMMLAIGSGSAEAAFFHLLTHAFFKAGLFLCVGAILDYLHQLEKQHHIHADWQDMHLLGGLRKKMPLVFIIYTFCMFSLVGLPFFSGFLSKEAILVNLWQQSQIQSSHFIFLVLALLSTFLTAFYIAKQWFLVFFGEFRLDKQFPTLKLNTSKISLAWQYRVVLSILGAATLFLPFSPKNPFDFLQNIWVVFPENTATHAPVGLAVLAVGLGGLGILAGFWTKTATRLTAFFGLGFLQKQEIFSRVLRLISQKLSQQWQSQKGQMGVAFWVVRPMTWLAEQTNQIELFWSSFLDNVARAKVVLAHIVAWSDKTFVDGFIHLLVYVGKILGQIFRTSQGRNVQGYFGFVIFFLLLSLLTYLIF
jgi:NADH-quinone oxidoreductase subunit L